MPKYYVLPGCVIRHDGETYHEGDEIEMEARQAAPKLTGANVCLSKTKPAKKVAATKAPATKAPGGE